ncbi:serine/threonine-protein kinase [Novosphingobium sp.]|uniref:serine/threonine-protein kinase n=1 Tax=Novosphingobium sp. TaxID=1874826 RepID=UPI0026078B85|nr:serine/threonine-protein kinase [Novosphingobium sp.]
MSAQDARALALVEEALGIDDPAARARFLDEECGADAALRARVEQLLALEGGDAPFLQTTSFVRAFGLTDVIAERIGPYRVTGEIARGGMGQVLSAERDDGRFQQVVAIKLIRADLASAAGLARFAEERRILARLRHPGIVRILDGGEHEGRPWLAMDLIDGLPVTEALERAGADRTARLDAFEQICEAVVHAHRNLVIHADLKPSNILMGPDRAVHLLDFGIARLVGDLAMEGAAPSPLTRGYAAPERTGGAAPTVASDVFSLGMLFVQMLTGQLPDGAGAAVPGSMLPTGLLKGDLAAIAAKALAVDPADRYPDVAALLSDVRRHRAFLPVRARVPAPWGYVAGRFGWRHRRGLALAGAAFVVLAGTSMVATLSYWRAEAARVEAEARFADARGAARYMITALLPRLESVPGTLPLRAETAAAAQRYLDRLAGSAEGSDVIRVEAAEGLLLLARHQAGAGRPNLGQPDRADANLRRADRLLALMARPAAQALRARVLLERVRLAVFMQGDLKAAVALAGEATRLAAAFPADRALARSRAAVMADLAGWEGHFAEEARLADVALALIPPGVRWEDSLDRVRLLSSKAEALYYQDRADAALPVYRAALAEVDALQRAHPGHPFLPGAKSVAAWNLGTTLTDLKQPREALAVLAVAEAAAREGLRLDPADREARRRLRVVRNARAQAMGLAGETAAALALLAEVRAEDEALLRSEPSPLHSRDVVFDHTLVGETLDAAGRKAEACVADRETMRRYDDLARRSLLTTFDVKANISLLKARLARNCLTATVPARAQALSDLSR